MDMVAQPLQSILPELEARQISYTLSMTRPGRQTFPLLDDCLYVVRQTLDDNGIYHIVIAAKMGKEVL